ncbi:hypothetical protein PINS_up006110 [Pythium insidiosum]|nr:hypothetical protein PINS_up006110 [Pythium insidiosum]
MDRGFLVDMYASPVAMAPHAASSSCSAVSTPTDTSSVEDAGSPWSGEDDQVLMEILMTADDVPMDVAPDDMDGVAAKRPTGGSRSKTKKSTIAAATTTTAAKGAKSTAAKQKMKLSATERRARHREVVRRSYHRNKQTLSELRAIVDQLEDEFRALTLSRDPALMRSDGVPMETQQRIEELKKQCAELNAKSEELRRESVRLQSKLVRHHEYARVVHECFDDTIESSSEDDEDDEMLQCSSPGTSEEDMSPHKHQYVNGSRHVLRAIHRPTYIVDLSPPAPIARDARKEVGFTPLSLVTAKRLVSRSYEGILSFKISGQAVSTGTRVLGWEDKRCVDGTAVNFSLRKSFAGRSCYDVMARTWKCFSDPTCASHRFRGLMELRVLQHVNEDTIIALRDNVSEDETKIFRCVYLLFRLRTTNGFLICVRSLDDIQLTEKEKRKVSRSGKEIQWVDLFGWFLFDRQGVVDPAQSCYHETGTTVEYGGQMNFGERSHVSRLVMDTLATALRWEAFIIGPIFSLPPSQA